MQAVIDLATVETGATARLTKTITQEDVQAFAKLSGDYNPLHLDADFARRTSFQRPVAHGMLLASFVSTMVGMQLPGPGALWTRQSFNWTLPVFVGDVIDLTLRVKHKSAGSDTVLIEVHAVNQDGKTVMNGEGAVMVLKQTERRQERPLSDRVVMVTGGSRGIGAAVAKLLAQQGAAVAVNYRRDEEPAKSLVAALREQGARAITVQADVSDETNVRRAFDQVHNEFGAPADVLVNNAAPPFQPQSFLDLKWRDMQAWMDVQVRGAFHCCQAAIPGMLEHKSGSIVNIGSILTHNVPPAQWTAFVASKFALWGLTRSLAAEFGPQGIRVNMVSPGTTETESTSVLPERLRKVQAMQTPLRRLATATDVAKAVVFLCSPASEFITGADVPVCGGVAF